VRYAGGTDPYCYPGTTVLKNRASIRDAVALSELETAMVRDRTETGLPDGRLDKKHYYALHRHLFQDVYAWAGKLRTIRIGKGGNWFCYPDFIEKLLDQQFDGLKAKRHLDGLGLDAFTRGAADFLAEVNAIHPFREGIGRTQLAFLRLLCLNAGFGFDASALERDRVISAMIASFDRKLEPLTELIRDIASPKKD
jgi:cell filamentation protein